MSTPEPVIIEHDNRRYVSAICYEAEQFTFARRPTCYEVNASGEILFAMPGGGRATEMQIRGIA